MKTYNAILAVPNIRGGGEFGGEWHRAGSRENKVCVQLPYIPDRTWTSLSHRGTLLMISLVLRMSSTILLS